MTIRIIADNHALTEWEQQRLKDACAHSSLLP